MLADGLRRLQLLIRKRLCPPGQFLGRLLALTGTDAVGVLGGSCGAFVSVFVIELLISLLWVWSAFLPIYNKPMAKRRVLPNNKPVNNEQAHIPAPLTSLISSVSTIVSLKPFERLALSVYEFCDDFDGLSRLSSSLLWSFRLVRSSESSNGVPGCR